ncbi:MAG: SNF2-related protein, partial [Desulfosarcina sp.]
MIPHAIEFHRNATALMPSTKDRRPGVAFYVDGNPSQHFCTCQRSRKKTCSHLSALYKIIDTTNKKDKQPPLETRFSNSIWYDLATVLSQGDRWTPQNSRVQITKGDDRERLKVLTPDGSVVITYASTRADRNRLAERLGAFSSEGGERVPDRAEIIKRLQLLTMTDTERYLHDKNMQSRRQALEHSLWFRLAYHCFLEFGIEGCRFTPSVDEKSGAFIVTCKNPQQATIFHAVIARNRVRALLDCFRQHLPNQHDLAIHPIPLKSLFRVSQNTAMDLDVFPVIQLLQSEGEQRFFSREGLERFTYGDLMYIPELKLLAELEKPGKTRQFSTPQRMTFKNYQIPSFLASVENELDGDGFLVDPDVKGLRLLRRWDAMTLSPTAIDRDWCWLSISYGFGDASISLADLLTARREATRYIGTPGGWVDTQSAALDAMTTLAGALPPDRFSTDGKGVRLSRRELFQFFAVEEIPPIVAGTDDRAANLTRLLALEPTSEPGDPGLSSPLREYQKTGLKWLWWLWENGLGGLLCDDMGLGKTHQVMALMACIRRTEQQKKPFIVVCPTTVLSHWTMKMAQHAPMLKTTAYYGSNRDLSSALCDTD